MSIQEVISMRSCAFLLAIVIAIALGCSSAKSVSATPAPPKISGLHLVPVGRMASPPAADSAGVAFAFAVSADGRWAATGDGSGVVRVWDVEQRQGLHALQAAPDMPIHTVAFSIDGARLVSGAKNGRVAIWDIPSGALLAEWNADGPVANVGFSASGKSVLASAGRRIIEWDPAIGKTSVRLVLPEDADEVTFCPESRLVLVPRGQRVEVWSIDEGTRVSRSPRHNSTVSDVACADEHFVASTELGSRAFLSRAESGSVRTWDPRTGASITSVRLPLIKKTAGFADPTIAIVQPGLVVVGDTIALAVIDLNTAEVGLVTEYGSDKVGAVGGSLILRPVTASELGLWRIERTAVNRAPVSR